MTASVAVVGLGAMGSRIAQRLMNGSHDVSVWNRTRAATDQMVELGATLKDSPADAARDSEIVITMVSDPDALIAVTEGDDGVLAGLQDGATFLEMSTVGPAAIARLSPKVPPGSSILDAPVLGSLTEIDGGTLKIFVGGDKVEYERRKDFLRHLGEPLHAGPVGSGAAAKLVANLTLLTSIATLGEAVALADGLGLNREVTFGVLGGTPIAAQAERRHESIQNASYPRRFALSLGRKDGELMSKAAEGADVDLRVAPAATSWFAQADEEEWGELDTSAVLARILGEDKPRYRPT